MGAFVSLLCSPAEVHLTGFVKILRSTARTSAMIFLILIGVYTGWLRRSPVARGVGGFCHEP